MRVALVMLVVGLAILAIAPAADARPPQPGGHCEVKEEYVTGASIGRDPDGATNLPTVNPGAPRPIECYY
ncbi:MAG: hypothetical protein AABY18_05325 [Candidatus Thermoplasmatota archaeon]